MGDINKWLFLMYTPDVHQYELKPVTDFFSHYFSIHYSSRSVNPISQFNTKINLDYSSYTVHSEFFFFKLSNESMHNVFSKDGQCSFLYKNKGIKNVNSHAAIGPKHFSFKRSKGKEVTQEVGAAESSTSTVRFCTKV